MDVRRWTLILLLFLLSLGTAHAITVGPVEDIGAPAGTVPDPGAKLQWQPYIPDTGTSWPIVLVVHGGGFKDGNMFQPTFLVDTATELAQNGFLALSINYRQDSPAGFIPGQTTSGKYPQGDEDVRAAIVKAFADSRWDGSKIFMVGGSGGASFALEMAGTGTAGVDRVAGSVCMSGIYDYTDRQIDPANPNSITILAINVRNYCGVHDDSAPNLTVMAADSPINLVDYATIVPLFLTHGTAETIPPFQNNDLVARLVAAGKVEGTDFIQVHTSTPTHAFANWSAVHTDVINFFRSIIAGSGPPPPPKPIARIIIGPPHGDTTFTLVSATKIIGGGLASWGNPHLKGRFKTYQWIDLQPDTVVKSVTGVAASDVITSNAHGYTNGEPIVLLTVVGGAGLTVTTQYYARDVTTNTFKIAATAGGAAINFTTDISGGAFAGYDFSDIDTQIGFAVANGQKFLVALNLNSGDPAQGIDGLPDWLTKFPGDPDPTKATAYQIYNSNHDAFTYQYLPWDTAFQSNALNFIAAFCDHVDGLAASVSMGGLGSTTEMHMPDVFPLPDGKDLPTAAAAWVISSNALIAQYAAHLHKTTFAAALAIPFITTSGTDALQSVVDTSLALYGPRIGFENWGLKNGSSTGYLPDKIIFDHRLTNPVGFQMTGDGLGGGGDLNGTLLQAMQSGVDLGAQYLMVFGTNASDPANYDDFDTIAAELTPAPPGYIP